MAGPARPPAKLGNRSTRSAGVRKGSLTGTTSRLNAAHIQRPATCPEAFDRVLSSGIAGPRGRPPYRGTVVKPWLRLAGAASSLSAAVPQTIGLLTVKAMFGESKALALRERDFAFDQARLWANVRVDLLGHPPEPKLALTVS